MAITLFLIAPSHIFTLRRFNLRRVFLERNPDTKRGTGFAPKVMSLILFPCDFPADTYAAFKDDCLSYSQAKKWHKSFKEGREEVADEARSGRPLTSRKDANVTRAHDLLNKDRPMSICLMSKQLNLPKTIVH
ncbi:hypothetical protein LAZ67_1007843 [Cordylochernes scorpioides]|uniref:Transposase n=1 Tax=Cordylochernes scorpioides TaxID=51811 RepID=A0ABY6K2L1_9ARAC|nr:hypothetical protein LAZ67_1007843 [Cordylochernes scorpioides]